MFFLSDEMPFSFDELLLFGAASGGKTIEDTATGNPLVFLTDLARPLKSLLIPFTPIQQGTGDPSPTNVRNIVPWNGLRLVHLDENLLNINRSSGQVNQGITYEVIKQESKTVAVHVTGQRTSNNPFFNLNYVNGTTVAVPVGKWKIKGGTANIRIQVFYKDANNVEKIAGYDDGSGATVTIPSDAIASWCRLLVTTDNPVDEVIYPIIASDDSTITETDISFASPIYGGTLDAVAGVLTVTHVGLVTTWGAGTGATEIPEYEQTRKIFNPSARVKTGSASNICNIAKYNASEANNSPHYYIGGSGAYRLFLPTETPDSTEIVIVSELAEPQTVQLTPEQTTALVGNNTIWSDADGTMTAVYFKKA